MAQLNKFIVVLIMLAVALPPAVLMKQFSQHLDQLDSKREAAIKIWAESNLIVAGPVLSSYRNCEQNLSVLWLGGYDAISHLSDCAKRAGSLPLAEVITESSADIEVPIPLRWLNI